MVLDIIRGVKRFFPVFSNDFSNGSNQTINFISSESKAGLASHCDKIPNMRAFLLPILIGLLTAIIAQSKGRSFFGWWIYGTLAPPFALIYALFLPRQDKTSFDRDPNADLLQCPHCKKMIPTDAKHCRHCNKKIDVIDV